MTAHTRLTRDQQRQRTRQAVLDAAERLFIRQGFHATSVDEVAAAAGYTKGAVYSNFDSKEDVFFAVYERRAARTVDEIERIIGEAGSPRAGLEAVSAEYGGRRRGDDGWLAVFFEFWAHVVRRPELRRRFAQIHAAAAEPLHAAFEQHLEQLGVDLPVSARAAGVALNAMQIGLQLERLVQPDLVDDGLGAAMARLQLDNLEPERRRR